MYKITHANIKDWAKDYNGPPFDGVLCDPPYELGFMGKSWDSSGIAFDADMWADILKLLKPGGHLLAFSGSRTYHRMASAIEDAGFEVRDMIEWVYGSGFPKSLNISKMLDKRRGTNEVIFAKYIKEQREKVGITKKQLNEMFGYVAGASWWEASGKQFRYPNWTDYQKLKEILSLDDRYDENLREMVGEKIGETLRGNAGFSNEQVPRPWKEKIGEEIDITAPKTDEAKKWEGWGTSLKPSHEPVICCAKPLTLELIFAKIGIDITNEIINLCQKYNVNVNDVEQALNSIHLKLEKAGVNTVAENARTCDWENIESVVIAGMSFTSPKPISKEPPEGYKVVSAPVSANQNGNEYLQENETLIGTAEDLSEQMDILLSTLATGNIDSNTVWLWKSILENVLQKAGTFTTSMALKTTIAWKTYKSLLSANTQNFTSKHNSTSPAHEPCVLARKPLDKGMTVAGNVLKHGTGGLNIDGTRIKTTENLNGGMYSGTGKAKTVADHNWGFQKRDGEFVQPTGRFPANLIHDGSEEVEAVFPQTGKSTARVGKRSGKDTGIMGAFVGQDEVTMGHSDSGSASRFFYTAKASRSERNNGLDGTVSIVVQLEICENNITRQENLARLQVVMDSSHLKATAESGIGTKSGTEWSMSLFGNQYTEKYLTSTKSTTKTTTSSITPSTILSYLTGLLTNENTLGANCEMTVGGSPAENAENSNTLILTINEKTASALGVENVQLPAQLKISVSDGKNFHSTVKPLSLTKYLATLIKPPTGGRLLVPFSGSGSEMIGALQAGWEYVEGVELTEEYIPIAEARIKYWLDQMAEEDAKPKQVTLV